MHLNPPKFKHDCARCKYLGQTIGGMRIHDLYVCKALRGSDSSPTLVARYGDEGAEYLSIDANYAHANGHAELFAAQTLWRLSEKE